MTWAFSSPTPLRSRLKDIYEDTNGSGFLHEHGVPTFWATLSQKPADRN